MHEIAGFGATMLGLGCADVGAGLSVIKTGRRAKCVLSDCVEIARTPSSNADLGATLAVTFPMPNVAG